MGMKARSTNAKGFVHYGGDLVAGVEDGIGVHLKSASTGSAAVIEAISDSDTAALTIRAKGAAVLTLGNSSNAVTMAGPVTLGAGSAFKGAYSTTFTWTLAALTSGAQGEITLTTSVSTALGPGDLIGMIELNAPDVDDYVIQGIRTSTVATSIVTIIVGNVASTATSTDSGTGRITWIDLT